MGRKRAHGTKKTGTCNGLNILAQIIAREEISKSSLKNDHSPVSPLTKCPLDLPVEEYLAHSLTTKGKIA